MNEYQKASKRAFSQLGLNRVRLRVGRMDANGEPLEPFVMIQENPQIEVENGVSRVELIDKTGKKYVNLEVDGEIKILFEDNGRTLKVFVP